MALRDIANETLSNYNPATDNPASNDNIPVGEYDVFVEKAGWRAYESGYDCLAFHLKVVGGEHADRVELVNINVDPNYKVNQEYGFIFKRNIKLLSQLAFACDFDLTDDDWEDQVSLGEAFHQKAVGGQFVLEITESPNKKDPSNPYRNYQFIKYAEDDLAF